MNVHNRNENCRTLHKSEIGMEWLSPRLDVTMPETVRRFDVKADFNAYFVRKQAGTNGRIRTAVEKSL